MEYNAAIRAIRMPDRIRALPISPKGYPVPWFVAKIDGEWDFRVVEPNRIPDAVNQKRCWVCGQPLGRFLAMTLGPMCAINRVISEPPSHRDCAVFSAIACPFLSNPRMRRREEGLPENRVDAPGIAIRRNPGTMAVWVTRSYKPIKAPGGVLFTFGDPIEVQWFAEGRAATRAEVEASIASGLPLLEEEAAREGPKAMAALRVDTARAMGYLPPAEAA